MQHLEVSGAVRPIYVSLGVKGLPLISVYFEVEERVELISTPPYTFPAYI